MRTKQMIQLWSLLSLAAINMGMAQENMLPTDLNRVQVGSRPPEFSLKDLNGQSHSLKQYEGKKNVVLVFYRGHW
jgi:peroxiredoxin